MKFFLSGPVIHKCISKNRWIFDSSNLLKQIHKWETQLPWIQPYYALKSNPSEEIIKILSQHNVGFDAASTQEILLAKKYSKDIIYTNPHTILHEGTPYLNEMRFKVVDDIGEIDNLSNVDLLIRMNSCIETANCKFDSKFGCTREEAFEIIHYANKRNLKVRGISFHIGSGGNHNRKAGYLTAYKYANPLLNYLRSIYNEIPILDIGGGLLASTDLTETLGWTKHLPYEIIAEPGRYYSEPSYHLLTQIISKTKRGIFLDNGVYHELNIYHRDHWSFPLLTHSYDSETKEVKEITEYEDIKIFGPTCDSYDTLNYAKFPKSFNAGDWIFLENMGAYTSAGNCDFNGILGASVIK
jgi:ornithine decarboxylase